MGLTDMIFKRLKIQTKAASRTAEIYGSEQWKIRTGDNYQKSASEIKTLVEM
jgi:hypothetical protein